MPRRSVSTAATRVVPDPMKGSRTTSPSKVYRSINRRGSSTGNGAGWRTRLALSACMSQTSSVASINSSVGNVLLCGSPSSALEAGDLARSNRPLLATMMRSVVSRKAGFAALRNEPHAQDPLLPRLFCQMISPRSNKPSASRIRITSAERLLYGFRPRFATLIAIRPPGSSTRTHSAKTESSMLRYSKYVFGTRSSASAATASSYSFPTK